MMGWYFFSQIWSYFYKIVIEIFGYQRWISDCLLKNVPKNQTFSKFRGNSSKINLAHILR